MDKNKTVAYSFTGIFCSNLVQNGSVDAEIRHADKWTGMTGHNMFFIHIYEQKRIKKHCHWYSHYLIPTKFP